MHTQLVMTVIGHDRPGLVSALSNAIAAGGGNWLDSRMASLAGQFAGLLLVEVPSARVAGMRSALGHLEEIGLRIVIEQSAVGAAPADNARVLKLELVGHDRPGIVRDISRVVAEQQVSISDFITTRSSASFSGEAMFKASALLRLPAGLEEDTLRRSLESLANELMVDLEVHRG